MKITSRTVVGLCLWAMLGLGCASSSTEEASLHHQPKVPELQPNPFLEQDNAQGGMPHDKEAYPGREPSASQDQAPVPPLRTVNRSGDVDAPQGRSLTKRQGADQGADRGAGSAQGYRMREVERERRFNQDQESRIRDYRRNFPHEPAPRPDSYRSYEGSRPPRTF